MTFHDLFLNSRVGYLLQIIPWMLLVGGLFWLVRGYWLKWQGLSRGSIFQEGLLLLFVCYLAGLIALICTPANFWGHLWYFLFYGRPGGELDPLFSGSFNPVPTMFKYLSGEYTGGSWIVFMYVGNALLFLPFGLLVPALHPIRLTKLLGFALTLSVVMELFQPIMGRSFDSDDLISNILGALMGWFLYCILKSVFHKKEVSV